jgi:hypothetical protein
MLKKAQIPGRLEREKRERSSHMKMNKILTLAVLLGMFCAAIGLASGSVCEAGGVGVGRV